MDDKDLYKLRAEDVAQNFLSLRDIEWKIAFQLYTGYALLGAAYVAVNEKRPHDIVVVGSTIVLVLAVYLSVQFLNYHIQVRQKYTRESQNRYLDRLHEILEAPKLEAPAPKYAWWYAYLVQSILSTAIAFALIAFVVVTF